MGAPQDSVLGDWVLMEDTFMKSAGQSRKLAYTVQCRRTGEGLKPRSHKELMKELELPGIEQRRQRNGIFVVKTLKGSHGQRGQCQCGLQEQRFWEKATGSQSSSPQHKRKYSQDLSMLKTREEGGSITHHWRYVRKD